MMEGEVRHVSAQRLECPICLNIFEDPRILSCSHTFCKTCLDNLLKCHGNGLKLQCPVCRADTEVVDHDVSQLQTNLALKSLIDDVENHHQVCTNCKSAEKPLAIVYCQDCGRYLCTTCQTTHSQWDAFSDHKFIAMSEIASGNVLVRRYRKCRKHPKEDEECFCSDCRRFACFRCGVMDHAHEGHRVIDASVYESNHLKSVEDLKSKADKKRSGIEKYVAVITEEIDLVSNVKKQCIVDVSEAYEESVKQLTEKKELLIGEVISRSVEVDTELYNMKEEAEQQISHIISVTDLVVNGTKIPLEIDALAVHDTLCKELQETLKLDDPDCEKPLVSSKRGKSVAFESILEPGEHILGKITCYRAKHIALPTKNSMVCMVASPDGRMAMGGRRGGISIYSADGQLQQTVLKDIKIRRISFLSDGRCVVRDDTNNITLYTTEWEKSDVIFETLNDDEGGSGGLDVDSDDQIYASYFKVQKIQVFSPVGGKATRELPCKGHEPWQITVFDDRLIIKDGTTISIIDHDCHVTHKVTNANMNAYAAVTMAETILVAWVNHEEGVVSVDEYNKELQHVKTLISDYKIEKPEKRSWYYLQEFRSGSIAFCTPDRLYIFHQGI